MNLLSRDGKLKSPPSPHNQNQQQHQRQRLSLHAALPPTLRLRSGQAFSQRTRKMGHPLFAGVGAVKIKIRINVNGFHCMPRYLPLFAKDAKNGAPFVWWCRMSKSKFPTSPYNQNQQQHQRQRLSPHAALPPTFRKGCEKWGTLCLVASGRLKSKSRQVHTPREIPRPAGENAGLRDDASS